MCISTKFKLLTHLEPSFLSLCSPFFCMVCEIELSQKEVDDATKCRVIWERALFLLSSSVKCGTTLADQGHCTRKKSNLWLFISSELAMKPPRKRAKPTNNKKELISAIFFFKKGRTICRVKTKGNDSCDVFLRHRFF